MGQLRSNVVGFLSRFIKALMVLVLIPLAIGLCLGVIRQLDLISIGERTARELIVLGFVAYVGLHIVLYRPVPLFQASHRLFAALAVWLFGGQVTSVERQGTRDKGRGKDTKRAAAGPQGSTLVAFSPYVIPSYLVLVCALGWLLARWIDRRWIDAPALTLVGMTIAFHWLMTADELQQQRARWHVETYLLAVSLVFIVTLLVGSACVPWILPDFSFVRALGDGITQAQALYTTLFQQLFF